MVVRLFEFAVIFVACVFMLFSFSCCNKQTTELVQDGTSDSQTTSDVLIMSTTEVVGTTEGTTESSSVGENDASDADTYIILDNENTTISGNGASFQDNILSITQSGKYSIKGSLTDGKIYIDCNDENKKVKLLLSGVNISCSTDAPLFVENSPNETILILEEGTENIFSDTAREVPTDENADYATATIYSKDDLQIEGYGTLTVNANFNKGIFSKNDIDVREEPVINITSADDGIRGKDSVEITGGTINITAGGDGIRSSETEETEKGFITISGGTLNINSDLDGIQAITALTISGGTIDITSGGGATGNTSSNGNESMMSSGGGRGSKGGRGNVFDMFSNGDARPNDSSSFEYAEDSTVSTKGMKSDSEIIISGGKLQINSLDDCIHAVKVTVSGGVYSLSSDDDGVHADDTVTVSGGEINIVKSYEGVEGKVINISDGNIVLKSSDDGFNAADGTSETTSQGGGMFMGGGMMDYDSSCVINMSGGYVHIDADGDGVDSNGNVYMTGGTIIVFGPVSGGNGALDYGGTFNISGGTLLALGSAGMAQSVTGTGDVSVLAFNYSQSANQLVAIVRESDNDEALIGFANTKSYSTVVFASDEIEDDEKYSVYQGGTFSGQAYNGVYIDCDYTLGTLVGTLS